MDPGPDAARHNFCAGERRPHWREGRPLLGRSLLPQLRHARLDYAQTDCRINRGDVRIREMFSAVLHSRQRYRDSQTVLSWQLLTTKTKKAADTQVTSD